jgi:hypothetical protein
MSKGRKNSTKSRRHTRATTRNRTIPIPTSNSFRALDPDPDPPPSHHNPDLPNSPACSRSSISHATAVSHTSRLMLNNDPPVSQKKTCCDSPCHIHPPNVPIPVPLVDAPSSTYDINSTIVEQVQHMPPDPEFARCSLIRFFMLFYPSFTHNIVKPLIFVFLTSQKI